jgi:hypothetical protein
VLTRFAWRLIGTVWPGAPLCASRPATIRRANRLAGCTPSGILRRATRGPADAHHHCVCVMPLERCAFRRCCQRWRIASLRGVGYLLRAFGMSTRVACLECIPSASHQTARARIFGRIHKLHRIVSRALSSTYRLEGSSDLRTDQKSSAEARVVQKMRPIATAQAVAQYRS